MQCVQDPQQQPAASSSCAKQCREAELAPHLFVLIQEHPELAHADALVPIIKAIGDVPTQGPKLAALLDQGMEEGQAQQQVLEGHRLAAALKELQVGQRLLHVAAPHVAFDPLHCMRHCQSRQCRLPVCLSTTLQFLSSGLIGGAKKMSTGN